MSKGGMRKQFVSTVESLLEKNPELSLLLGDIGVFGFKEAFKKYSDRVLNIGILEQSTIGVAAGMAKNGLIPIVHTIAPFLIERAFEQIKTDFCYQNLGGNFVTVGASYDYAALGCTHHCPGDIELLQTLPRMQIVVPGTSEELDQLFRETYSNGSPTYFRLSERENPISHPVKFGKAQVLKRGSEATFVVVGPALKNLWPLIQSFDATVLYYTTVAPFDRETLKKNAVSSKFILFEPSYEGGLSREISQAMEMRAHSISTIGVPRKFLTNYGTAEEQDHALGLSTEALKARIEKILDSKVLDSRHEADLNKSPEVVQ